MFVSMMGRRTGRWQGARWRCWRVGGVGGASLARPARWEWIDPCAESRGLFCEATAHQPPAKHGRCQTPTEILPRQQREIPGELWSSDLPDAVPCLGRPTVVCLFVRTPGRAGCLENIRIASQCALCDGNSPERGVFLDPYGNSEYNGFRRKVVHVEWSERNRSVWASEVSVSGGRKGVAQQLHLDSDIARLIHLPIRSERMTLSFGRTVFHWELGGVACVGGQTVGGLVGESAARGWVCSG